MIVFNQLQSCLVVADSLEAVNVMSSTCLIRCVFIASLFHLWSHHVSGEYNVRLENSVTGLSPTGGMRHVHINRHS